MSFIKDFKAFAMKGSVIDLAVAVIIGGAFGKIVSAMVDDIIMPLVGTVTGGKLFTDNFFVLKYAKAGDHYDTLEAAKKAGANVFAYGHFIQTIFDFLIIALFIFIAIQGMSKLKKKEEAAAPAPAPEPSSTDKLLMEIRDRLPQKP